MMIHDVKERMNKTDLHTWNTRVSPAGITG